MQTHSNLTPGLEQREVKVQVQTFRARARGSYQGPEPAGSSGTVYLHTAAGSLWFLTPESHDWRLAGQLYSQKMGEL